MNEEIVIVMGYNAAGKTTLTEGFEKDGYTRFNRDTLGGNLAGLVGEAERAIKSGAERIVLDNTYPTVKQRAEVVALGKRLKIPVRCVHLNTSFEDAQFNACLRMLDKIGKLADTKELTKLNNPNLFPPVAIYTYRKAFEKPTKAEGFSKVEVVKFVRTYPSDWTNKAVILDYDQTLRDSTGPKPYPLKPSEVKLLPGRKKVLDKYKEDGFLYFGASNQSGVAKGVLTAQDAEDCFDKTNQLVGHDIKYAYCPHSIPPVVCFCRKPAPGLGVYLMWKHKIDPRQSVMVGDQTTDVNFAKRCGFQYLDQSEFFA